MSRSNTEQVSAAVHVFDITVTALKNQEMKRKVIQQSTSVLNKAAFSTAMNTQSQCNEKRSRLESHSGRTPPPPGSNILLQSSTFLCSWKALLKNTKKLSFKNSCKQKVLINLINSIFTFLPLGPVLQPTAQASPDHDRSTAH